MFIENQSSEERERYANMLRCAAMLSRLSSDSTVPYLGYRITENAFCEAFDADNLSRSDCSADAAKNRIGIGIKTFIHGNGKTIQKVAEFNRDQELYRGKTPSEIVSTISHLRNERLQATKRIHGLDQLIYHCVAREPGRVIIYETPMDEIAVDAVKDVGVSQNILTFKDGMNEYSFNISKSTLSKRFYTSDILMDIPAEILDNPFDLLTQTLGLNPALKVVHTLPEKQHVFLPLFSDRGGRNVPEKSGLNQWNAAGRARDYDEIYIPIPLWLHRKFPGFFPQRDTPFELLLPDRNTLSAKICQDGGKALMSNPNAALGKWLLRNVMNLKEGELLTYDRLKVLGLDSVIIYKETDGRYSINFTQIGSYDAFAEENK